MPAASDDGVYLCDVPDLPVPSMDQNLSEETKTGNQEGDFLSWLAAIGSL